MTDNDIVTALECCTVNPANCNQCPLDTIGTADCFHFVIQKNSLDLINRQKAEIERLQGNMKFVRGSVERLLELSDEQKAKIESLKEAYSIYEETTGLKQVRDDAYRKFSERLCDGRVLNDPVVIAAKCLVKEMTEETP